MGANKFTVETKAKALDEIFARIAGGEALVQICGKNRAKHLPSFQLFNTWLTDERTRNERILLERYELACIERQDFMANQLLEIADESINDKIIVDGKQLTNHEAINRSRLRVDARKWLLSKMNPKRFGDKVDVTTDGEKIKGNDSINISIDGSAIKLQ